MQETDNEAQRLTDSQVMEVETGIRALYLLYKRGQWGYLEDLGLERAVASPRFAAFESEHLVGNRLTKKQCAVLVRMVPGLEEAGKELRLAYALKAYDERASVAKKEKRNKMEQTTGKRHYLGEVRTGTVQESDGRAFDIAAQFGEQVMLVGGRLDVAPGRGEVYAILALVLPDGVPVPDMEDIEFKPVAVRTIPAVPNHGITE